MTATLDKIRLLQPLRYEFIKGNAGHQKSLGFIAQELKMQFPELVSLNDDGRGGEPIHTVDYGGLGVVAIAALRELADENDQLKKGLSAVRVENTELQNRLDLIENRLWKLEK